MIGKSRPHGRLNFCMEDFMTSGKMTRRFPLRPKATFSKAVSGQALTFNMKPVLGAVYNKIIPLPTIFRDRTKTPSAILNFPVRA